MEAMMEDTTETVKTYLFDFIHTTRTEKGIFGETIGAVFIKKDAFVSFFDEEIIDDSGIEDGPEENRTGAIKVVYPSFDQIQRWLNKLKPFERESRIRLLGWVGSKNQHVVEMLKTLLDLSVSSQSAGPLGSVYMQIHFLG